MADNTKQFEWIATIKGNLDSVFKHNTDVFVAGDLLWYPVEGSPKLRVAPDVMVAFGRPKGYRGSYKQWKEDNIPPQVVFEILSPGNTVQEMNRKFTFYARYGVEEYYLYDPDKNVLSIYRRDGQFLQEELIEQTWVSPLMGITFILEEDTLQIKDPNGKPFLTYLERTNAEEAERLAKEAEKQAKEEALKREEAEKQAKEEALKREEIEIQAKEEERLAKEEALKREEIERQAKKDALAQLKEEEKAISEKDMEIERLLNLLKQSGLTLS
jgi:hypothetical protein